ncbi:DNA gyrase inhibitor YacG [Entomomonas asaccharolytica]|uniref:DNA gyrase inhibitor YacG n=1 Tax=Entomomonas asaccharolytica TaxID=2785331 RepID=A0A974RXR5_9GAMM|nr:DNA gyrase inhibitor YacG [Entomomonas asaccharolytica]QQP86422.1 DNA gyrase inhibitor YacG [Entomomonas asaccharolytica]
MKKHPIVNCPTCQKSLTYSSNNPYRPFCSKRCKLIDLGAWAAEEHSIAGQELISDEFISEEELAEIMSKKLH